MYTKARQPHILRAQLVVSGVKLDRSMGEISGSANRIRTITFPQTITIIRQIAFCRTKSLASAVLNERPETLETNEYLPDGSPQCETFEESALRHVRLPSTLR